MVYNFCIKSINIVKSGGKNSLNKLCTFNLNYKCRGAQIVESSMLEVANLRFNSIKFLTFSIFNLNIYNWLTIISNYGLLLIYSILLTCSLDILCELAFLINLIK